MDDTEARTIEELADDADERAPGFAATVEHFGVDSPRATAYADLGIPFSVNYVDSQEQLAELRRWRDLGPDARRNATLMDNTTITAAAGLLTAGGTPAPTALTLWDLARFVDAVIAYDSVHHFAHPEVDDGKLDARLDDQVFRAVTWPTEFSYDPPAGLIFDAWQRTKYTMEGLLTSPSEVLTDLCEGWSRVTGRSIRSSDLIDSDFMMSDFHSPSARLLAELAELTHPTPITRLEGNHSKALVESNYRGHFTQQLANVLDLPYRPSIARIPFRRLDVWLPRAVDDQLLSLEYADTAYRKRVSLLSDLPACRIGLPVLLAVLLRRSTTRADLWPELAGLREQAARYRARRADLDDALALGDEKVVAKVVKAVGAEASNLRERLARGGAELEQSAVTIAEAGTAGGATPLGLIGPLLSGAFAAARVLIDPDLARRIIWRTTHPQYRFLSDIRAESRGIITAMPRITRIWPLADGDVDLITTRFAGFADLAAGGSRAPDRSG